MRYLHWYNSVVFSCVHCKFENILTPTAAAFNKIFTKHFQDSAQSQNNTHYYIMCVIIYNNFLIISSEFWKNTFVVLYYLIIIFINYCNMWRQYAFFHYLYNFNIYLTSYCKHRYLILLTSGGLRRWDIGIRESGYRVHIIQIIIRGNPDFR